MAFIIPRPFWRVVYIRRSSFSEPQVPFPVWHRNTDEKCDQCPTEFLASAFLLCGTREQTLAEAIGSKTITKEGLRVKQMTLTDFKVRQTTLRLSRFQSAVIPPVCMLNHLLAKVWTLLPLNALTCLSESYILRRLT